MNLRLFVAHLTIAILLTDVLTKKPPEAAMDG